MAPKKSNKRPAKRTYAKKAPSKRMSAPRDGTNVLLSAYAEVTFKKPAGTAGAIKYSIKCDSRGFKFKLPENTVASGSDGFATSDGTDAGVLVPIGSSDGNIPLQRFDHEAQMYNLYRVNSVKCVVLADKACLNNQIFALTDKGVADAPTDVKSIQAQAHKYITPTDSKREMRYGWKPSDTKDKEWKQVSNSLALADSEFNFIKVYQQMEKSEATECTHRIQLTMSVSLKDSKAPSALN